MKPRAILHGISQGSIIQLKNLHRISGNIRFLFINIIK